MKKTIVTTLLFFIVTSCVVYEQLTNQNDTRTWDTVLAEVRKGGYNLITPDEIKKEYLKEPTSLFLIDTRQEWEYQRQHIEGALNLPVNPYWWYPYSPQNRKEMRRLLGPDKNKRVIFYCEGLA